MCDEDGVIGSRVDEEDDCGGGEREQNEEGLEEMDKLISMLTKDGSRQQSAESNAAGTGDNSSSYVDIYVLSSAQDVAEIPNHPILVEPSDQNGVSVSEDDTLLVVKTDGEVKVPIAGAAQEPATNVADGDAANELPPSPAWPSVIKKQKQRRKNKASVKKEKEWFQAEESEEAAVGKKKKKMKKTTEKIEKIKKTKLAAKERLRRKIAKRRRLKAKIEEVDPLDEPQEPVDERLQQLLPMVDPYRYKVKSISEIEESPDTPEVFRAHFTVNLNSSDDVTTWKRLFESKSQSQYNVVDTKWCDERYVVFKQYLKCHHNVLRGKLGVRKHTGCPARLTATILAIPKRIRKGQTKVDVRSRCEVVLTWNHNHPLLAVDILRHQSVTPETQQKLIDLFKHGHSPRSAVDCIRMEIEDNIQDGENLENMLASRALCPDYQHCHYIFKKLFWKQKGMEPMPNEKLVESILNLNSEMGGMCIAREEYDVSKNIVAVCTPFMRRVHEHLAESGELVYVFSAGGFDHREYPNPLPPVGLDGKPPRIRPMRIPYRILVFSVQSKAGDLPVAIGITPSETLDALTRLFTLIKVVLPDNAFHGRGRDQGPAVMMTDDSVAQQGALANVWPNTRLYLCQFRVLQAQWKWLQQTSNGIRKEDRPHLFGLVKKLMYAETEPDLAIQCELFCASPMVGKYSNFRDQISDLFENKKAAWCCAFRHGTYIRGNPTNGYSESSMRVLKEEIIQRARSFNLVQMVNFIAQRFTPYYERRLLDYASNRQQRAFTKFTEYEGQQIDEHSEDVFEIASGLNDGATFTVNLSTTLCSCFETGGAGAGVVLAARMCQHLHYVHKQICGVAADYPINEDGELMYLIACGDAAMSEEVLASLVDEGATNELRRKEVELDELWKAKIAERAQLNPRAFIGAYSSFIAALKTISTANAAVRALYTFGKQPEGDENQPKRLKISPGSNIIVVSAPGGSQMIQQGQVATPSGLGGMTTPKRKSKKAGVVAVQQVPSSPPVQVQLQAVPIRAQPMPLVPQPQQQELIADQQNFFSNVFELRELPISYCSYPTKWS